MTFPVNNIQADSVRLRVYRGEHAGYAEIARFEVYGCYNTSTPTIAPTPGPTELPTILPSPSPTLPPITPSIIPTTVPTGLPSTFPTTGPTWSPTEPPSPTPSFSPSTSPTVVYVDRGFHFTVGQIEFFLIIVVILCAVLFFGYRYHKKVLKAKDDLQKTR